MPKSHETKVVKAFSQLFSSLPFHLCFLIPPKRLSNQSIRITGGTSEKRGQTDTCALLWNRCAKFYGVVREESVCARADSTSSERVWPRVSKLYQEKIYFPVTATTYPDAFTFPRPSIQFLNVCGLATRSSHSPLFFLD